MTSETTYPHDAFNQLSHIKETTYGTKVTTTQSILYDAVYSPTSDKNVKEILQTGDADRTIDYMPGMFSCGGTLSYKPVNLNLIRYLFSAVASTGAGAGSTEYYTKAYTLGKYQTSFTLDSSNIVTGASNDQIISYKGSVMKSYTLNWGGQDSDVTADVVLLHQDHEETLTGTAPDVSGTHPGASYKNYYKGQNMKLTIDAKEYQNMVGGSISLDSNVLEVRPANSTLGELMAEPGYGKLRTQLSLELIVYKNTSPAWDWSSINTIFKAGALIGASELSVEGIKTATKDTFKFVVSSGLVKSFNIISELDDMRKVNIVIDVEDFTLTSADDVDWDLT